MGPIMILFGLALIIGPYFVPGLQMDTGPRILVMGFGLVFAVLGAIIVIITKLYQKTSPDIALVRTGLGGKKVVINGGINVLPVVHNVIPVWLRTMKLESVVTGKDALICGDNIRADVVAEFYLKVDPTEEGVANAAASLGDQTKNPDAITHLTAEKFVNALRAVAARTPLRELNTNREKFAQDVLDTLKANLEHNGLQLEGVTISKLDQTPINDMKEDNIFDSDGRKNITEVVSKNNILANEFKREAEIAIATKDTQTKQAVTEQETLQATYEAQRNANISMAQAEQEKEAAVFRADQDRLTKEAQIDADQKVGERDAAKDQMIRVAQVNADKAAQTADVERLQAVEVANRGREIAIANKEAERATAQALQLAAEKEKTVADQAVITAQETAAAERQKQVLVIAAQKDAAVRQTNENIQADIEAYKNVKVAEGDLEAAQKKADAVKIAAEADKAAKVLEAQGQQAIQIVPVNVENEQVSVRARFQTEVEQARVNVLQQELKAKSEHTQVSVELQQALALITAMQEIGKAQAEAMGKGIAAADMKFFGDPSMLQQFSKMFGTAESLNGFLGSFMDGNGAAIGNLVAPILSKFMNGKTEEKAAIPQILATLRKAAGENPELCQQLDQLEAAFLPAS